MIMERQRGGEMSDKRGNYSGKFEITSVNGEERGRVKRAKEIDNAVMAP
jgi:hypothetical protein